MWFESGIFGFVVLFVALAGLGDSKAAQAADDEIAKELRNQMAALMGATGEGEPLAIDDDQSVRPVALGAPWSLFSSDTFEEVPSDDLFGTDDTVQGLFPSPMEVGAGSSARSAAWTFHLATATRDPSGTDKPSTGRAAAAPKAVQTFDPLTDHFWPVAKDDRSTDISVTFSEPLRADEVTGAELFSPGTETTDDGELETSPGPTNFRISDSVKIKAQPVGGGLGGRVTFTFVLPNSAQR